MTGGQAESLLAETGWTCQTCRRLCRAVSRARETVAKQRPAAPERRELLVLEATVQMLKFARAPEEAALKQAVAEPKPGAETASGTSTSGELRATYLRMRPRPCQKSMIPRRRSGQSCRAPSSTRKGRRRKTQPVTLEPLRYLCYLVPRYLTLGKLGT